MNILIYNELNVSTKVKTQFDRTVAMLEKGDFRAADAKKMRNTGYYRAKLNDADRLLFRFGTFEDQVYILLLEVIYQHAYDKSRFLNGAMVDESKLEPLTSPEKELKNSETLRYINPKSNNVHFLGKVLSFDDEQASALSLSMPLILIGSAGSGKTVLTLEKMKPLKGELLYVTHSPYLAESSRNLYYANGYDNPKQEVDFLSFNELLAASGIPAGTPMDYRTFNKWFDRHRANTPIKDAHMLFEEFNGVLTGCPVDSPYLSREDYLDLGIRRSIFTGQEREQVYDIFQKYLAFLNQNGHYNVNLITHSHLNKCQPRYDFVVVDEVQDITNVQLMFILKHLRHPHNFLLSGDSNQIVHPNFFSWSNLKTMFYEHGDLKQKQKKIMRILVSNYRNSQAVTDLANKILLVKNARFGSVDRESNYLVRCVSETKGEIDLLKATPKLCNDFNDKTSRSTRYAVLVLREEDKAEAAKIFETPLVFSIQEAKGLEYENIILYNMISSANKAFNEIVDGVTAADLQRDDLDYTRAKDKSDKSLEAFKFFINAFYVAITRSVKNLYLLEQRPSHPLYDLLKLTTVRDNVNIAREVSSQQEWQSEAGKLEKQGKTEQAEEIRRRFLGQKPVPWRVLTLEELPKLESEALNPDHFNKKAKSLLFDYAICYGRYDYMPRLAELKFNAAKNPEQHERTIEHRYTQIYKQKNLPELTHKLKNHGPNFRDPMNRTPLMIAAALGMHDLIKTLLAEGASPAATDNNGLNAFMIALNLIVLDKHNTAQEIVKLFDSLPPQPLIFKLDDRMLKIDPHHHLFLLIYAFLLQGELIIKPGCNLYHKAGLTNQNVVDFLQAFPTRYVPDYRKKKSYISALLAANECVRGGKEVFLRFFRGHYVLNPRLHLQVGESWVPVTQFCNLTQIAQGFSSEADRIYSQILLDCLEEVSQNKFTPSEAHSTNGVEYNELYLNHMKKWTRELRTASLQEHNDWYQQFVSRNR